MKAFLLLMRGQVKVKVKMEGPQINHQGIRPK